MATTSGIVTTFDGATGLLQTLMAWLAGTVVSAEVADDTPNGIITSFSGTLANTNISPGQVSFAYTIGAQEYTATINGAGTITGTHITSGSITHSTGVWAIVFSTAPDDTTNITADYIYGEAGRDWKVELNRRTRDNVNQEIWPAGDPKEYIISNTGTSGDEKIYIGLREWEYPAESAYGIDLNCYLQYVAGEEWNSNTGEHNHTAYSTDWEHYTEHPMLPLADDSMGYWIYSNKQRIVIVGKVAGHYESAYLGFGRRFGAPSTYPYPLLAIGSAHGTMAQSDVTDSHQFICAPRRSIDPDEYYNAWVCSPGNAHKITDDLYFLPYHDYDAIGTLDKTSNTKVLMTPVYIVNDTEGDTYMDLDEVYHVAATNIQSEDRLQVGANYYKLFQNVFRSEYYDYMAVKEA